MGGSQSTSWEGHDHGARPATAVRRVGSLGVALVALATPVLAVAGTAVYRAGGTQALRDAYATHLLDLHGAPAAFHAASLALFVGGWLVGLALLRDGLDG
jgi:hypothetical protein